MKSFFPDALADLILGLVVGKIDESEFVQRSGTDRPAIPGLVTKILSQAIAEQDATWAELGLSLGHRFGFGPAIFDTLRALLEAQWHERHEDVVDALADLATPSIITPLGMAALRDFTYRRYDDARSLRSKAIQAIASVESAAAVSELERLLRSAHPISGPLAERSLRRLAAHAGAHQIRRAAAQSLSAAGVE